MIIACKCLNTVISFDLGSSSPSSSSASTGSLDPALGSLIQNDERYRKNPTFCKELKDFIRNHTKTQALIDLQLNTSQKDLVLTIPIRNWEINYCLNCNKITHAVQKQQPKQTSNNTILINDSLQRKHEDIMGSRADQSYSSTFGIKMINHQPQNNYPNSQPQNDEYHLRLKSLNKTLIQRIQKEVDETNQRIQRYSEQQFALLKNFREKSESEYQNLVSLVKNVPENLFEMQFYNDPDLNVDQGVEHPTTNATDASDSSAINNTSDTQPQPTQITSFDTPPATPESTPMSVGNSPVFRQQQQQQSIANNVFNGMRGLLSAVNNGAVHTNNTSIIRNTNINNNNNNNNLDDCVFELEGLETYPTSVSGNCNNGNNMSDDEDDNETEDAQDALGELDSNPSYGRRYTIASSLNVAKSVPIGIAQSVENDQQNQMSRSRRNNIDSDDEVLGDNIDIAASMKALARSLHGNQVFGELPPRPRLYSYKI